MPKKRRIARKRCAWSPAAADPRPSGKGRTMRSKAAEPDGSARLQERNRARG
ncbi:hypothetical protein B8V81_1726 [Paenibacillus pasadenensis]|uniref:Uncharacterized protein n=1 Tax=Paenibacillus pasadenensis TaxID=217090 RepID=A0A2N5NAX4_9BACL|nr:hypothetical protein B8V81_1726 [Paenibacillus pasadenensis]